MLLAFFFRTKPRFHSFSQPARDVHLVAVVIRERRDAGQLGGGRRERVHVTVTGAYPHVLRNAISEETLQNLNSTSFMRIREV